MYTVTEVKLQAMGSFLHTDTDGLWGGKWSLLNNPDPGTDTFKYLGTTIFRDLKWSPHVTPVWKKAHPSIHNLYMSRTRKRASSIATDHSPMEKEKEL